ncbi:MAG: acyl-CoA dehydrogenase C-terminal domain-containing protein, partial [Usitatibacter sp.]
YLKLMGITLGGWMMARSAQIACRQLEAGQGDGAFLRGKLLTTRFYCDHILAQAIGLSSATMRGADSTLAVEEALL